MDAIALIDKILASAGITESISDLVNPAGDGGDPNYLRLQNTTVEVIHGEIQLGTKDDEMEVAPPGV